MQTHTHARAHSHTYTRTWNIMLIAQWRTVITHYNTLGPSGPHFPRDSSKKRPTGWPTVGLSVRPFVGNIYLIKQRWPCHPVCHVGNSVQSLWRIRCQKLQYTSTHLAINYLHNKLQSTKLIVVTQAWEWRFPWSSFVLHNVPVTFTKCP